MCRVRGGLVSGGAADGGGVVRGELMGEPTPGLKYGWIRFICTNTLPTHVPPHFVHQMPPSTSATTSPTLLAALFILFGALWLYWLSLLHPLSTATTPSTPLRCHQVAPVLRSTLLAVTVLLAASTAWILGQLFVYSEQVAAEVWLHRGIPLTVLFALFLVQIAYLVHIRRSRAWVDPRQDGCSASERGWVNAQRWVLVGFAVVQVGVGGWLLVRGG